MIRLTRSPSVVKERVDIELDGQPLMRALTPADAAILLARFEEIAQPAGQLMDFAGLAGRQRNLVHSIQSRSAHPRGCSSVG